MKTLIILTSAILVTSTSAFAQKDINDKPITCTAAEANESMMSLYDDYQSQGGTRLEAVNAAGKDMKEELQSILDNPAVAGNIEPDKMAAIVKQSVCFMKLVEGK